MSEKVGTVHEMWSNLKNKNRKIKKTIKLKKWRRKKECERVMTEKKG